MQGSHPVESRHGRQNNDLLDRPEILCNKYVICHRLWIFIFDGVGQGTEELVLWLLLWRQLLAVSVNTVGENIANHFAIF